MSKSLTMIVHLDVDVVEFGQAEGYSTLSEAEANMVDATRKSMHTWLRNGLPTGVYLRDVTPRK